MPRLTLTKPLGILSCALGQTTAEDLFGNAELRVVGSFSRCGPARRALAAVQGTTDAKREYAVSRKARSSACGGRDHRHAVSHPARGVEDQHDPRSLQNHSDRPGTY